MWYKGNDMDLRTPYWRASQDRMRAETMPPGFRPHADAGRGAPIPVDPDGSRLLQRRLRCRAVSRRARGAAGASSLRADAGGGGARRARTAWCAYAGVAPGNVSDAERGAGCRVGRQRFAHRVGRPGGAVAKSCPARRPGRRAGIRARCAARCGDERAGWGRRRRAAARGLRSSGAGALGIRARHAAQHGCAAEPAARIAAAGHCRRAAGPAGGEHARARGRGRRRPQGHRRHAGGAAAGHSRFPQRSAGGAGRDPAGARQQSGRSRPIDLGAVAEV